MGKLSFEKDRIKWKNDMSIEVYTNSTMDGFFSRMIIEGVDLYFSLGGVLFEEKAV